MKILTLLICTLAFFSCKKTSAPDNQPVVPSISSLNCSASTISGAATAGTAYNGTITVPYTGGNGIAYPNGTAFQSTGVTGLTIILQGNTLSSGSGNLVYTVSGTPSTIGTANILLSFGGQSCTVSINVLEAPLLQYGVPFANVPDRQDATIYQVNMRAFSAQSNLQGVIARLDSIKALGANVIYLMPIYPVGTLRAFNSPYCIKDYKSVGAEFGTLADLRALVDGAHSKNMSVILDWVANHTAWDHPWVTTNSEYYSKDANNNIISPPGQNWTDVAQLNFNSAAMRLEMIKSMKYWIYAANVDGYRCDYADGPPMSFWKQAIDTLRNITTHKLLLLGEGSRADHFTAGFDFTFGFNFYGQLKSIFSSNQPATLINGLNNSEFTNATNGQQVVRYTSNHDVNGSDGTPADLFGGTRGSMAAFVIIAYMKGTPMIYNGQEVGTPFRLTFPFTGADINWSLNPDLTAEYKRIIAFRNTSAAVRRGTLVSYTTADVCAFTKELGTEKVFVVSNARNAVVNFTLPASVGSSTWTDVMTNTNTTLGTQISLQPYSYTVLKK